MKRLWLTLAAGVAFLVPAAAQNGAGSFTGRWDMTITTPNSTFPGWLEVADNAGELQVRVQPRAGSVHPVKDARIDGGHLIVPMGGMSWNLAAAGGKLTGTVMRGDTAAGQIEGVRAPALKRKAPKSWSRPEALFNGTDLSGWEPDRPEASHWVVRDGVLLDESKGANLKTTRKFDDFKLHIEFNCPENGNSGVYLRGRYEVQVEYEPAGTEDAFHSMGAIYGMVPAQGRPPRTPGEWESFDVTLVGRWVTIQRNGKTIVDNQEIAGITGGALDSREGESGPFYIQGDHTGGMKYRNITISLPK